MVDADSRVARIVSTLAARPGVRGIALVGSRASAEPGRVDRWSDADFLVCCREDERNYLLSGEWADAVGLPLLRFPRVTEDEVRILFPGLFAIEVHLLEVEASRHLSGPCELGSHLASAFAIRYDPDGLLEALAARVAPEPEDRDAQITSSVFWYDLAYCANLVARGDLFRANMMANVYLPLFLLAMLRPIEGPDDRKEVASKVRPDQYDVLAAAVSPLTPSAMRAGLRRCMACWWRFQAEVAPDLDPATLDTYRRIEREVERTLDESDPARHPAG